MLSEVMIEKLKKLAAESCCSDDEDFNAYDYSGGNFDDAYYAGTSDGEISSAREIIEDMAKNSP